MHHAQLSRAGIATLPRLVASSLACLLLLAAPVAVATDNSPALYEAALCKSIGGDRDVAAVNAFWRQRLDELSRQASPAARQKANDRAADAFLDFSAQQIERERTFCRTHMTMLQRAAAAEKSNAAASSKFYAEQEKFHAEQDRLLEKFTAQADANSAEKARCLVITQVMQHHAQQDPTMLAPADDPARQQREMASVDRLVAFWDEAYKKLFTAKSIDKAQKIYAAEKARYGEEWNKQQQLGNQQLFAFMTDNAMVCQNKMKDIIKREKQR